MKSEVENFHLLPTIKRQYPFLAAGHNVIVLFTSSGVGMVVQAKPISGFAIGFYSDRWVMEGFRPLPNNVKVTLQNDL